MKKILSIILLLVSCYVHGQEKTNYIDYHKHIIVAEQQFLYHDNLNAAFEKYKEIFEKWEKPFARDCLIALQLACMIDDTARATYFFQKCFENGVEWNTVFVSPHVQRMLNSDLAYKKRMGILCDKHHKEYLKTIDTAYRNIVISMFKHEIELRGKAEQPERDERLIAEWMRVEDSNMYELIPMIKRLGYPGERRIGLNIDIYDQVQDNRRGDKKYKYNFTLVDVYLSSHIITMFYHHRCGYQMLKNELMQAVIDGELNPREYAMIYEWSHAYFRRKHWDDEYHVFKCEREEQGKNYNIDIHPEYYSADTKRVDKDRIEIGICSLNHDKKKKEYAILNKLYLYFGMFNRI